MILTWNLDHYLHLTRETKKSQKIIDDNVMSENGESVLFFQFTANLEQSGSRIPDARPVKFMFSLIVTFYVTKTENRTKKFVTQLSRYYFE